MSIDPSGAAPIVRVAVTVLDCPDPQQLANFYSQLLNWPATEQSDDSDTWMEIQAESGQVIAFQQVQNYQAPQWPGQERPQQMHLDFYVSDLDEAERRALALGASKHDTQPGTTFRVFLDPEGHPFCLCQGHGQ